jgi:hypothetical protein
VELIFLRFAFFLVLSITFLCLSVFLFLFEFLFVFGMQFFPELFFPFTLIFFLFLFSLLGFLLFFDLRDLVLDEALSFRHRCFQRL